MSIIAKIGARIEVLREKLGNKTIAELEKGNLKGDDRLLGNGVISSWIDKPIEWTSDKLEKFLTHYNVNRTWWKTGEGEVFITPAQKPADNKEKMDNREDVYRTIVEGHTEYLLVPREVLKETQLVSTEQIKRTWEELAEKNKELAAKNQELERKNVQLDFYQNQFAKLLENLELSPKSSKA